jgi:methionyl-tRNA synthetase
MSPEPTTVVLSPPPTPNGPLHLGHLAGPYVAADVAVRALRLSGRRVL